MTTDHPMCLEPIGRVVEGYSTKEEAPPQGRQVEQRAVIEIDPDLVKGLEGLKDGSWIWVLLWFHKARPVSLMIHPRGDPTRPLTGLFNSRSPNRPNSLGLDLGRIESIAGNKLVVTGLDAITGTPVLDIKPYLKDLDRPPRQPLRTNQ